IGEESVKVKHKHCGSAGRRGGNHAGDVAVPVDVIETGWRAPNMKLLPDLVLVLLYLNKLCERDAAQEVDAVILLIANDLVNVRFAIPDPHKVRWHLAVRGG